MSHTELIALARQRLSGIAGVIGFGLGFVDNDQYGIHVIVSDPAVVPQVHNALADQLHKVDLSGPVVPLGPERR